MLIDRLKSIPLRELWRNEAYDFTTWLAENLDFLGAPKLGSKGGGRRERIELGGGV